MKSKGPLTLMRCDVDIAGGAALQALRPQQQQQADEVWAEWLASDERGRQVHAFSA